MKISNLLRNAVSQNQKIISALLTFREYCTSTKNKILRWMGQDPDVDPNEVIAAPINYSYIDEHGYTVNTEVLGYITKQQYADAVDENFSTFEVSVGDDGLNVNLTGDELVAAVEEAVSGSVIQAEFVDYCISSEEVSPDTFKTKIATVFQNFSAAVLESFGNLLGNGSPMEALKGLMASIDITGLKKSTIEDNFIEVVTPTDYTGVNVWLCAWNKVVDKVSSFFIDVVWEGLKHIGDFLKQLGKALLGLGLYVLKLISRPLFSRYDALGPNIGVMDYPIIQIPLCKCSLSLDTQTVQKTAKVTVTSTGSTTFLYNFMLQAPSPATGYKQLLHDAYFYDHNSYISKTMTRNWITRRFEMLGSMCTEIVDGAIYRKPVSFTLPAPSNSYVNFMASFGFDENDVLWMQVYSIIPKAIIKSYNDKEVYKQIRSGFDRSLLELSDMTPMNFDPENYDQFNFPFEAYVVPAPTNEEPDDNYDLAGKLTCVTTDCSTWTLDKLQHMMFFILFGVVPFISMSEIAYDACATVATNVFGDTQLVVWKNFGFYDFSLWHTGQFSSFDAITADDLSDITGPSYFGFVPFVSNSITPVSIHYQNLNEAATEIIQTIISVLIAAVVAWASVKFLKYSKKRKALATIKRGAADNASWTMGNNPTAQQIKDYLKMDRAARKVERMNRFLGISSNGDNVSNITSAISSMRDVALQMSGVKQSDLEQNVGTTTTSSDVYKVITGHLKQ